jgi:crotonobetainyl-CoA:carnitine CoA-transferase CaiB-like acyl-CoA transferase
LGEHTDEVLRDWLALTPDRIAALRAGGVLT